MWKILVLLKNERFKGYSNVQLCKIHLYLRHPTENPPRGMRRNIGMKVIEPVHCKKYATHVNRPRISGILLILRTNSMEADFLKLKRVIKQMLKLS